ncbi:uncharacterized protein LOC120771820 isoform X1 [Bactrocera tryoni]|uniref:uncharacterized protein LOC120771820 isoform X1 n=1 Tax=Bactrocera tryoni TaxID=59916 RepID=UPI001A9668C3|nr:uncharacterized protein LOC120771820 isoform X1 [Bactrocera tryoni]
MAEYKTLCPKIIKITALILAFLLLVKTFLCFLLSFAILEEPPEDWPQRLKEVQMFLWPLLDDCHPKWYSWFSLILNAVGVVVYSYMYFGILNTHKFNLLVGLIGVTAYLIVSVPAHIALWILHTRPHTMMTLNCMGTAVSVICSPLSYIHYRRILNDERIQEMEESEYAESKKK